MLGWVEKDILLYIAKNQKNREWKAVSLKEMRKVFGNKVAMTLTRLVKKGYLKRIAIGYYRVSDEGMKILSRLLKENVPEDVKEKIKKIAKKHGLSYEKLLEEYKLLMLNGKNSQLLALLVRLNEQI
jgi:predicted transcriptional regulator of viral defense system